MVRNDGERVEPIVIFEKHYTLGFSRRKPVCGGTGFTLNHGHPWQTTSDTFDTVASNEARSNGVIDAAPTAPMLTEPPLPRKGRNRTVSSQHSPITGSSDRVTRQ